MFKKYPDQIAAIIVQVYEVDLLRCPKCGAGMKIIAFIQQKCPESSIPEEYGSIGILIWGLKSGFAQ